MFKHVLVPTDGSPISLEAVRRAASMAKETGARVSALYVKTPAPPHYWSHVIWTNLPEPGSYDDFSEKEAQQALAAVEEIFGEAGIACTTLTRTSEHVYQAILEVAAEQGCDLIFMASHGRRGVEALILGSETHKVLTHSKIPVLVYR